MFFSEGGGVGWLKRKKGLKISSTKGGGLLDGGSLFEKGGLIEDLRYVMSP